MTLRRTEASSSRHYARTFLLGYAGLLIYGSLFPLEGWREPAAAPFTLFADSLKGHWSRADMLTNLLVYMPFGLLLALWLRPRVTTITTLLLAIVTGMLFSLCMELTQMFLPDRFPSLVDIAFNTLGSAAGASLPTLVSEDNFTGERLLRLRRDWIKPGPIATFGLLIIALWAASHLCPFVPSLDVGSLGAGLRPLWQTLNHPMRFELGKATSHGLQIFSLGLLALSIGARARDRLYAGFGIFVAAVLLTKVTIVSRALSAEVAVGAAGALLLLYLLRTRDEPRLLRLAAVALLAAFATEQLRPELSRGAATHSFGWRLFEAQMQSLFGLADILATFWPFAGLAFLTMRAMPQRRTIHIVAGGVAVLAFATILELLQQYIPGRYPDISHIVVPVLGWGLPWFHPYLRHNQA